MGWNGETNTWEGRSHTTRCVTVDTVLSRGENYCREPYCQVSENAHPLLCYEENTVKRCDRCIMPETVPGITFTEGVCNFCLEYQPETYLGEEALDEIVRDCTKGNDAEYDCLVPISGGRDSAYVLYVARAIYGLRTLAVNYDNEFRAEQALRNMQNATSKLGADFLSVRSKRNIATRMVRSQIRWALSENCRSVARGLCTACARGYTSIVYRIAIEKRIPLIFWGDSQVESTGRITKTIRETQQRGAKAPPGMLAKLSNPKYCVAEFLERWQRLEFHVRGNRLMSAAMPELRDGRIKEVHLFDYLKWDRARIKETIQTELGWQKPATSKSTWRIDCALTPLVNHEYLKEYGCSKACFGYCNMINGGHMTRAEALEQEEATIATCGDGLEGLLSGEIGLSRDEVRKICTTDSCCSK